MEPTDSKQSTSRSQGRRGLVQKLPQLRECIHFPLERRFQLNELIIYGNLLFPSKLAGRLQLWRFHERAHHLGILARRVAIARNDSLRML
jgi:hypothetical protein